MNLNNTFNLYISKKDKDFVDQLEVISSVNNTSLSHNISLAIKHYVQSFNEETPLLANKEKWDKFISTASKEELYQMSRVICGINDSIVRKVMK